MQTLIQNQSTATVLSSRLFNKFSKGTFPFSIILCFTIFLYTSGYSAPQKLQPYNSLTVFIATPANTDDPFKIYKNWYLVIETKDHIEVFARIVQCEQKGAAQIHFNYFNESGEARTRTFSVKVTNIDGKSFTIQKTVAATPAAMYIADCSKGDPVLDNLKIDIPANYNPEKITISIIF